MCVFFRHYLLINTNQMDAKTKAHIFMLLTTYYISLFTLIISHGHIS